MVHAMLANYTANHSEFNKRFHTYNKLLLGAITPDCPTVHIGVQSSPAVELKYFTYT